MRTLAISDIHGRLDEFRLLLKRARYNFQEDRLVLLGDYVDRGMKSRHVLNYIMQLQGDNPHIFPLRGNHDQMMIDAFRKNEDSICLNNGGLVTLQSYVGLDFFDPDDPFNWDRYTEAKKFFRNHFMHHIEYLENLPYYFEWDNHIFVHAGINPFYEEWRRQPVDDFLWIRDIFYNNTTGLDQVVVFGHTPTQHLHNSKDNDIWFDPKGDKIGIDGACAYRGQLNCLIITEAGEYETYAVRNGEHL